MGETLIHLSLCSFEVAFVPLISLLGGGHNSCPKLTSVFVWHYNLGSNMLTDIAVLLMFLSHVMKYCKVLDKSGLKVVSKLASPHLGSLEVFTNSGPDRSAYRIALPPHVR
jgi:hypothetical protein